VMQRALLEVLPTGAKSLIYQVLSLLITPLSSRSNGAMIVC